MMILPGYAGQIFGGVFHCSLLHFTQQDTVSIWLGQVEIHLTRLLGFLLEASQWPRPIDR